MAVEMVVKVAIGLTLLPHIQHHEHHPEPGARIPMSTAAKQSPKPATIPVGIYTSTGPLSAAQVESYAARAGFPASLLDEMVAIAFRESRFDSHAVNTSSGACGLWQIYPCPGPEAMDPLGNALLAREKCLASVAAGYSCLRPWGG